MLTQKSVVKMQNLIMIHKKQPVKSIFAIGLAEKEIFGL